MGRTPCSPSTISSGRPPPSPRPRGVPSVSSRDFASTGLWSLDLAGFLRWRLDFSSASAAVGGISRRTRRWRDGGGEGACAGRKASSTREAHSWARVVTARSHHRPRFRSRGSPHRAAAWRAVVGCPQRRHRRIPRRARCVRRDRDHDHDRDRDRDRVRVRVRRLPHRRRRRSSSSRPVRDTHARALAGYGNNVGPHSLFRPLDDLTIDVCLERKLDLRVVKITTITRLPKNVTHTWNQSLVAEEKSDGPAGKKRIPSGSAAGEYFCQTACPWVHGKDVKRLPPFSNQSSAAE